MTDVKLYLTVTGVIFSPRLCRVRIGSGANCERLRRLNRETKRRDASQTPTCCSIDEMRCMCVCVFGRHSKIEYIIPMRIYKLGKRRLEKTSKNRYIRYYFCAILHVKSLRVKKQSILRRKYVAIK